jgi:hypothetical protein
MASTLNQVDKPGPLWTPGFEVLDGGILFLIVVQALLVAYGIGYRLVHPHGRTQVPSL